MTQAMDGFPGLADLSADRHVLTIGNFDGVHRGHQYLIQRVIDEARRRGDRSLVVTFEPHPIQVLRPDGDFRRLTTPERKYELLLATGIDAVAVVPFTPAVAALSAVEFLRTVRQSAHPSCVFVGEGFQFGRNRSGNTDTIRVFGEHHGYETVIVERIQDGDLTISSSSVRTELQRGAIARANAALGRRFRLAGLVEHGDARGRELGFPTANVKPLPGMIIPADGIYAGFVHIENAEHRPLQAMIYIGTRPTFDGDERLIEAHILDFQGDLYASTLDLEFVAWIRGDQRFDSAEELSRQMEHDELTTRSLLASTESDGVS